MAHEQRAPGGHYSGHNPIPNIQQFINSLDSDKRERDKQIDEEAKRRREAQKRGEAVPHQPQSGSVKGTEKRVTDPTTGKEVVIADVNDKMLSQVENPTVREQLAAEDTMLMLPPAHGS